MIIPNNVGLTEKSRLNRQLLSYQRKFRRWWKDCGPSEFLGRPMQLRTPTGEVHGAGWTSYHTMTPAEYQWGLYTVPTGQTHISFGMFKGRQVWKKVPEEYRSLLIEHIRVQADVENAAVEQSRTLTRTAPSGTDLNNLFQFYLEEGRHTWAMVHLLIEHFGEDGIVEAEALLERMSGDAESPRLLDAFNYQTDDWLSHYMWCFLADRVGKYQIRAVTQSAFAPLASSARFMMLEEPLHISFGSMGLERLLCRSAQLTAIQDTYDIFDAGAIPLPVIQKYLNYWTSKIYDLFGNDESRRAVDLYEGGIRIPRNFPVDQGLHVPVDRRVGEAVVRQDVGVESVPNTFMRRQYTVEVNGIVDRWNAFLARMDIDFRFTLPDERFNRQFGPCSGTAFNLAGDPIDDPRGVYAKSVLPSATDATSLQSLMVQKIGDEECCASWTVPASVSLKSFQRTHSGH